jgi:tight adherence protein B
VSLSNQQLFTLAVVLAVSGVVGLGAWGLSSEQSPVRRLFAAYARRLQLGQELLLSRTTGARIAALQLALVPGAIAVGVFLGVQAALLAFVAIAVVPPLAQHRRVKQRRARIGKQVESWTMLLASALKATGSIPDAVGATSKLTMEPISEEIELVLKELQLGTPLDRALRRVATRVNGAEFEAAVLALIVGRQTGGDVPRLLETLGSTLRERERMDGVMRKELAGFKTELMILSAAPPIVLWGVIKLLPGAKEMWFGTPLGNALLLAVASFWVLAILVGRRIVGVDV